MDPGQKKSHKKPQTLETFLICVLLLTSKCTASTPLVFGSAENSHFKKY